MDILLDETTSETLRELEKTQKEFWNVSRTTGLLLNTIVKMSGIKSALEIGTSNGYSGLWIAKALKTTGGNLTTIEYFDKRQSVAIENFKKCGVFDIVLPIQGSACDIIRSFSDETLAIFSSLFLKFRLCSESKIISLLNKYFLISL